MHAQGQSNPPLQQHTRRSTPHTLAQESAASTEQELREAISAKDEAIGASERARAEVEAAEGTLAMEQARAEAAERELTGCVPEEKYIRFSLLMCGVFLRAGF